MGDNTKPSTPGTDATTTFTPNETKLICAVMQNLTSEIQFDVDKVALDLGYKNAGSLRARWNSLKRSKISGAGTDAAPTGGVSKATPSKKAKATPKKAKATSGEGGEDGEETPSKKAGKGSKTTPKVKTEEGDEEVVNSVEGPEGVALGDDTVWES